MIRPSRVLAVVLVFLFMDGTSVLSSGAAPQPTHAPPVWNSSNPPFFAYEDLVSNYWELYPRGEDVVIEAIAPLEGGVGLVLTLRSSDPDFDHFLYTIDEGPERKSSEGRIILSFENDHSLEDYSVERRELRVHVVTRDGVKGSGHYLNSNFYPMEMYHARGRTRDGHGRIHIRETDMEMATSPVEDWILDQPDAEAIAFARRTWGHLVDPDKSPYENARSLARSIVHDLTPHRGTPSNVMDGLDPFAQYRRLMAGEDSCWCANISEIFSYACNAFGIPTRFIIMRHQLYPPPDDGINGYEILMATGHTTNEVFDAATGSWIWMDLTYNTLGAWLGDQGPLNMLEFHRFLNQPRDLPQLQVDVYDPASDSLQRIPLVESDLLDRVNNAFKQDQLFRYMRKPGETAPSAGLIPGAPDEGMDRFPVSDEGSGRATAYLESPKIISHDGRTHVAWLDTPPEEGFRVRIRTFDQATGEWSPLRTIGLAENNHGGPALTIDEAGFLHVLYYSHHHPFRYRRSVRPNDTSEWTDFSTFGTNLTYPALVVAGDGTLVMTARRSYADRPWELEMWIRPPGGSWKRQGAVLRSRFPGYAQFAASLAWEPDHQTLYLGTRIYELPEGQGTPPLTTVGILKSPDGGRTWARIDGSAVTLPADAESLDVIASGRGREGRVLNAGSIAVNDQGLPFVPYSVRLQDASHAYLASPDRAGGWRHLHLNPFLPDTFREWDLFMHGGIAFGHSGQPTILGTIMQVPADGIDWGHPSTEIIRFQSVDGGATFEGEVLNRPDPSTPRWMPSIERPTGFNTMPRQPGFLYTEGVRGDGLDDQLDNRVWFVR